MQLEVRLHLFGQGIHKAHAEPLTGFHIEICGQAISLVAYGNRRLSSPSDGVTATETSQAVPLG